MTVKEIRERIVARKKDIGDRNRIRLEVFPQGVRIDTSGTQDCDDDEMRELRDILNEWYPKSQDPPKEGPPPGD